MNILYSWEFEDNNDRGPYWYIIALSIIVWIAIWWFITNQYWMSIVILFISWLFYYIENNSEDVINVTLSDVWVQIWKKFYDYSKIEKYTYIYEWENPILLRLVINRVSIKHIDLKINMQNMTETKNILPNYIEEDAKWELSFMERLIYKMKL